MNAVTRRAVLSSGLAVLAAPSRGRAADDGFVTLHARAASTSLPWGKRSRLWGYEETIPGPLLRGRQGETLRVRLVNGLDVPTALHFHGVRLPNAMDGSPLTQEPVPPGGSFDYVFIPPDAGTFWYHSLFGGPEQRERGLYGMLVVDEREAIADLHDVPIIVDDWLIDAKGGLDEAAFGDASLADGQGRLGAAITVNGRIVPTINLQTGHVCRLRFLNAANARHFTLTLDAAGAALVSFDGQPCVPMPFDGPLSLAPGQRADAIVAAAGSRSILAVLDGNGTAAPLARLVAEGPEKPSAAAFPGLRRNAVADYFNVSAVTDVPYTIEGGLDSRLSEATLGGVRMPMTELRRRGFHYAVNGSAGLSPEPMFRVRAGVTVAVTVDNITRVPQVLHIHGHAAWLIERGGRKLDQPLWHDTFVARSLEPVKVLFIADNPGRWLIASAVAEHYAAGCQSWFEVLP